jgi:hypothetical protein
MTITIFAHYSFIEQYRIHILDKLEKNGTRIEDYSIAEVSSFNDNNIELFFSEGVDDFNHVLKMGIVKIATEYAYYNGVSRDQLTRTLDVDNRKFVHEGNVIPFFPVGLSDRLIELHRPSLERHYPTHTLVLFTQRDENGRKALLCYVDLFSTFQFYIILNDDYKGEDINKNYCQDLEKNTEPCIIPEDMDASDIHVLIGELGIASSALIGKTIREVLDIVRPHYLERHARYELNLAEELSAIVESISAALVLSLSDDGNVPSHLHTHTVTFKSLPIEVRYAMLSEWHNLPIHGASSIVDGYRKVYSKQEEAGGLSVHSSPCESAHLISHDVKLIQEYGHMKFEHLSSFVGMQNKM